MTEMITEFDAERIVDAFRTGVVPPVHLNDLCIGREEWFNSVKHDLDFVAQGTSKVRFLSAPWGGGKTHFLLMIKEDALKSDFVVSYVELNSREAPLDRFEIVFPRIIRGLVFPGGHNLESVLDSWATEFPFYNADEISAELRKLSPSLDFRAALRGCLMHAKGDLMTHREILRDIAGWLGGDSISPALRKFGVYNPVKITNVSEILGSFLRFVLRQQYNGIVVMLDEAEAVTSLTQSKRRTEANQNIRKLLDNTDENVGMYIMFATTPSFLTDSTRGARSYPALWSRIHNIVSLGIEKSSKRSIIIPLEPLNSTQLFELARRVIELHSKAYDWNAKQFINDDDIESLINKYSQESKEKTIRSFIRTIIFILDSIEEKQDEGIFKSIIDKISFEEQEPTEAAD